MNRNAGLVFAFLALAFGCGDSTPLRSGSSKPGNPDAAPGSSGGQVTGGGQAGQSGTALAAGQSGTLVSSASQGGSQTGGVSTTNSGGLTNPGGGNSRQGGTASTGTGGTQVGGMGGSGTAGRTGGTTGSGTVGGASAVAGTSASSRAGSTTGGASTVKGGSSIIGGTSAGGAAGSSSRGGTTTIVGGSTSSSSSAAGSGGSATAGTTVAGSGGSSVGGQTVSTSPANDSPGQNPFTRSAGSGVLITSSDGLNSIDLHLAADSKGGMFVAGATRNPQAMGLSAFDAGIESEAFAARLDSQGKMLWSVPLKTCGVPADIAAGPDDALFVLCPFEPDATSLMPATCDSSAVVDKLSGTDGKLIFEVEVKPPAQPTDGYMCPYALGVDSQGRSYVGGGYTPTAPLSRSILIAVTASGQQGWTLVSEGPAYDPITDNATSYITGVDVDSNGNVLFVGGFNTWTQWGTEKLTSQAKTGQWSSYNGFFARVPANGTGVNAWRFGGTVFDLASAIAPTPNGGFVVGGWGSASTSIGGKSFTGTENGSAFIAQITSAGQATWVKALPTDSITDDVAVGPDGKVYFVGQFANDEILYTYDPATDSLTPRKTVAGTATGNEMRTSNVAVSTTGSVWISGSFKETINLGTGALSTTTVATFLFKIN